MFRQRKSCSATHSIADIALVRSAMEEDMLQLSASRTAGNK